MESFDDEIQTFDKQQKQSITKPVAVGRRKQIVAQEDLDNYILVYLEFWYNLNGTNQVIVFI